MGDGQGGDEQRDRFALLRECTLIARRWRTFYDGRIAEIGLTAARASVIYWLSESDHEVTQVELAGLVGIEGPTLVRQLHALSEQGLVTRSQSDVDRRSNVISLTEAGWAVSEEIRRQNVKLSEEVLGGIAAGPIARELAFLRRVRREIDRVANKSAYPPQPVPRSGRGG
jgi:MarR family transcriptional regulator, transcriptional regulator for hemolysin